MNFLTKEFVWRARETLGLESTDPHKPKKEEIIAYLGQMEIAAALGAVIVKTKAELDTVTNKPDYTPAIVGGDPNQALSGYYQWLGNTWNYVRDLADSITRLVNIGGTGNAITAELRLGVSLSAVELAFFVPAHNNTSAVTITVEGVEKSVRNGLGNELSEDDLQAGYPAMVAVFPGQDGYVLLNPANVEAVVLAAKQAAIAARNQAQTAKQAAEEALSNLEAAVEQASELAFQRFNKLYLGSFNVNPSTDNQGGPLKDGMLCFHSVEKKMKVYSEDDSDWILATPDTSDFLNKANNLGDVASKSAARSNLGLGALATSSKVGMNDLTDSSVSTGKLKSKAVTDPKLNSAKLNTLVGKPQVVALYSNIGDDASFNLTRSGATYTFGTPQPDTSYVVQVVGQRTTQGNLSYINIVGMNVKSKASFSLNGLRLNSAGSISGLSGGFDVIVYRVAN
ncbi:MULTISPECIES: hypothetical protein [unclassified Pseudovibrio]|uniref:hypothetical protein n=1 Tax=unclassified Pseudovibrio TaxID=2627060 RepID=UPI0007AE5744|nr:MULTISPECIES: hypothetical protein [unclassified Pseudovibrio]KZL00482.1 hypothetical protein PsW74_02908 [Pseudovibrio sp. W74]KZL07482.1 hypothetical protein PsAD14_03868 [Pseudovibrio sp. Ad14]